MNMQIEKENRLQKLKQYLLSKKLKYNLVHIHHSRASRDTEINRVTLLNDIRLLLEQGFLKSFHAEANLYEISITEKEFYPARQQTKEVFINGKLEKVSDDRLSIFTPLEREYLDKFERHRKQINKPLSPLGLEECISRAIEFKNNDGDVVKAIQTAISGGHSQFYDTKINKGDNKETFLEKEMKVRKAISQDFDDTQSALAELGKNLQKEHEKNGNTTIQQISNSSSENN